jgi:hypothetical protein
MRISRKPVHACYSCLLNLGDRCWLYRYPRGQWRGERRCPAFENDAVYEEFRRSQKQPTVKTRKELRREFFRKRKRTNVRRDHGSTESGRGGR